MGPCEDEDEDEDEDENVDEDEDEDEDVDSIVQLPCRHNIVPPTVPYKQVILYVLSRIAEA